MKERLLHIQFRVVRSPRSSGPVGHGLVVLVALVAQISLVFIFQKRQFFQFLCIRMAEIRKNSQFYTQRVIK